MDSKFYIAYGSNLNKEQMKFRCPTAKIIGTTVLQGFTLRFRGSLTGSYLTVEEQQVASVPFAVWATTATDEKALDRYEGYSKFYYKENFTLPVSTKMGLQNLDGYIYIMLEERPLGMPSMRYVQTCLDGYRDFGFDKRILLKAVTESRENYEK